MRQTWDAKKLKALLNLFAKIADERLSETVIACDGAVFSIRAMTKGSGAYLVYEMTGKECEEKLSHNAISTQQIAKLLKSAKGSVSLEFTDKGTNVFVGKAHVFLPHMVVDEHPWPSPKLTPQVVESFAASKLLEAVETIASIAESDTARVTLWSAKGELRVSHTTDGGKMANVTIEGECRGNALSAYPLDQLLAAFGFDGECEVAFGNDYPLRLRFLNVQGNDCLTIYIAPSVSDTSL